MPARFGMIGLGTMGRNLLLNIADHGFEACGYDRDEKQREVMIQNTEHRPVITVASSQELVNNLTSPRVIMLLVPAGKVVDLVLDELIPQLQKGDIVIDGGNSHYIDTERRYQNLRDSGVHFIGMGVSGGEDGARYGPSLMPGGNIESFNLVKDILEAVAAKADGEPCVAFMGNTAAGHYVKMVHNGIEYAMMQLISEVYGVLKNAGLTNQDFHQLFDEWNKAELKSFLVEITAAIFEQKDPDTGKDLVDLILDEAEQLGTGQWTSQSALELGVPVPTIDISVSMRYLSSLKKERTAFANLYGQQPVKFTGDIEALKLASRKALYQGFMLAYAQGLELLRVASIKHNYDIDLRKVIKVWRGGCIIRSAMLNDLHNAYDNDPALLNIIGSPVFIDALKENKQAVVEFIKIAMDMDLPASTFSSVQNYLAAYISEKLPANLIQAQRDFFGAHTYRRIDQEGIFHTNWEYRADEA